ncbi:hypothetical protein [Aliamphritea spongicola]|nr:hypothetical protein [Aliamphritea spongicola]
MAKREDNAAGNGAQTDQYTTDVVHFDRRMANANGTIHNPIHPSVQYTFESVDHLIGAFQGRIKGIHRTPVRALRAPQRWKPNWPALTVA